MRIGALHLTSILLSLASVDWHQRSDAALPYRFVFQASDGWIIVYILTGIFWLPVVWMQMEMRDLAIEADRQSLDLPLRYHELFRR